MEKPGALSIAALIMSLVAIALGMASLGKDAPAPAAVVVSPTPVQPVAMPDVTLALAQQLREAERRIAALEARAVLVDGGAAAIRVTDAVAPPEPRAPYVKLEAPAGVLVTEIRAGAFSVKNTDPAMTGKNVLIKAVRADGGLDDVMITVPAPGR